jgi:hypothetical protein
MRSSSPLCYCNSPISRHFRLLLALTAGLAAAFTTGCGGSSSSTSTVTGYTPVTVLATSTGNDQMTMFHVSLNSLALTSQSGKTVTVFSTPQYTPQSAEYMHLNGSVAPLTTVSIPQDTYTSASATIEQAYAMCAGVEPTGGLLINGGFYGATTVTVNVPGPIAIAGDSMGLALDLQVAPSLVLPTCVTTVSDTPPIMPVFNLRPVTIAAQPTNSSNGMAIGLHGLIDTVSASGASFSLTAADGPVWEVSASGSTVFQGVTGASQLAAGMPVDMDAAIQSNGSLLATRVAVYDTNPSDLSVSIGPLLNSYSPTTRLDELIVESQGLIPLNQTNSFTYSNTVFQISGQLSNVQSLPFTASFNAANMVPGQNVLTSNHAPTLPSQYFPLTTMTLLPQTINGTVSGVSSSGSFTTYTVALAPYDLFTILPVQPGETTTLTNPGSVVVYVDSNTQLLNPGSIAVGSMLRFNGLVFNDNGTLRMDCAQINDGVEE